MATAHADAEQEPALQPGCEHIMQRALLQLRALPRAALLDVPAPEAPPATATTPATSKKGKAGKAAAPAPAAAAPATPAKVQRAVRAAAEGLYSLLGALQGVMAPDAHLQVGPSPPTLGGLPTAQCPAWRPTARCIRPDVTPYSAAL